MFQLKNGNKPMKHVNKSLGNNIGVIYDSHMLSTALFCLLLLVHYYCYVLYAFNINSWLVLKAERMSLLTLCPNLLKACAF